MADLLNIPDNGQRRLVIVGAGFGGLKLALKMARNDRQIVVIDRNNFHQFQPLFYQVATAGLEPSAISFPLRKIFQHHSNVHFRIAELEKIHPDSQTIHTSLGDLAYDELVLAMGAGTNFYGNSGLETHALAMKSTGEALLLRNTILEHFEQALNTPDEAERQALMNVVIVGGGPTGVELAGAIAEMKKYVLPKDYPELDFSKMQIHLFEAADRLLAAMSEGASARSLGYLKKLGVDVRLGAMVAQYDGHTLELSEGEQLQTKTLIWAAGIRAQSAFGLPESCTGPGNRLLVDEYNQLKGIKGVYAIGDQSLMITEEKPKGDPQVAQTAIQQAVALAKNLKAGEHRFPFKYKDKGSLATIGRNLAVADLPGIHFGGFLAWVLWLFVHLMAILGTKNRLFIFLNWAWSYLTYDQSLRLMIRSASKDRKV